MALYAFRCPSCAWRWETFAASDRPKASTCPSCGHEGERQFTPHMSPESFGKNMYVNRKPLWAQRPADDDQAAYMRQKRIEAGAGTVFGQVPGRKVG